MANLSIFTLNKKILSEIVILSYNQPNFVILTLPSLYIRPFFNLQDHTRFCQVFARQPSLFTKSHFNIKIFNIFMYSLIKKS